ncbi:TPA: hypothetical protein HA361_04820 [Candidatus Woesearchaeota archaeon]|nr:hypothetical protein [Candidatus Woesearchaeota archaeon]HII69233.1 hypothetical protein [Candidatus Woesearchaeota archaeon]
MALTFPESMDECLYFTRRVEGKLRIIAWVLRPHCPACAEGRIGKPIKKDGKPYRKSPFYACSSCGHEMLGRDVEAELKLEVQYTCPHCGHSGETITGYQRKVFEGVPAYVFQCDSCNRKIGITKKMKGSKKRDSKGK